VCYHYSLKAESRELNRRFLIELEDSFDFDSFEHMSCFTKPPPILPVITNECPEKIQFFQWGLIPFWSKGKDLKYNTANAKLEGIESKPSWRKPIRSQRCLVPATGFFEWRNIDNNKYPYYISLLSKDLFAMAGIWDRWVCQDTGEIINSFSLITTVANALMEKIHNTKKRMPLILAKKDEQDWLNNKNNIDDILPLLNQYPAEKMQAHTIRKDFFLLGGKGEKIVAEFEYPELSLIN